MGGPIACGYILKQFSNTKNVVKKKKLCHAKKKERWVQWYMKAYESEINSEKIVRYASACGEKNKFGKFETKQRLLREMPLVAIS